MKTLVGVGLDGVRLDRRLLPYGAISFRLPDLHRESGPNAAVLRLIHRAPDGFVPLAIKSHGAWRELGAVPITDPLPFNAWCQVQRDAYFGLNGSYRTGVRPSGTQQVRRPVPPNHPTYGNAAVDFKNCVEIVDRVVYGRINRTTGLPFAHHDLNSLRWLNVAFIDIDCYGVGLMPTDALQAVLRMQEQGEIPPPSMFAFSGRGLWCLWLLVDVRNRLDSTEKTVFGVQHRFFTPQRASRWALATYNRVQRELWRRLQHLGADSQALDATRFGPLPGTLKTNVGTEVAYWAQETNWLGWDLGFAYRLPVLETALGIELDDWGSAPAVVTPRIGPKRDERVESGKKGWFTRWQHARADLEVLLRLRHGGFDHGCRNRGAFFYALVLTRAGVPNREVDAEVTAVGRRSRPPLSASEIRAALRQARRDRNPHSGWLSHHRIMEDLAVTPKEAEHLSHLPRVRKSRRSPKRRSRDARLVAIRTIVEESGTRPSLRKMVKLLKSRGIVCAPETIRRDYLKLNAD